MRKVIYYEILNYHPTNIELLKRHFHLVTLPDPSALCDDQLQDAFAVFAPLGYRCGSAVMEKAPALKAVVSNTTGDAHIDTALADQRGIRVITLKTEQAFLDTITPTAELTLGLMIALTRNLVPAFDAVRHGGQWERWPFGGERMLSQMTLGVLGMGRLGSKVATAASTLGMRILWVDPYVDNRAGTLPGIRCHTLAEVAEQSDIITLHVPHEPHLTNLLDETFFAACKPGAYFVNTARGELVDETALLSALQSGHLAGAALDVLAQEFTLGFSERVAKHPLVEYARTHANVLLTPHIGGSTRDAWRLTQERVVQRLVELFACNGEAHDG